MCTVKKKIFPDVYSSTQEKIHPQKFLLVSICMAKHMKIPEPHTSDERVLSFLERVSKFLVLFVKENTKF